MKRIVWLILLVTLSCSADKNPLSPPYNFYEGVKFVFTSDRDSDGSIHCELGTKKEIYIMDMDGGNQKRLTYNNTYDFNPVFSPDGTKILFTAREDWLDGNLIIMDIDGQNSKNLGGGEGGIFSPDGSKIIYQAGGIMCRMDINGSNKEQLTEWKSDIFYSLGQDLPVQFSHDGSKILFLSCYEGSKNDIFTMDVYGASVQQLTDTPETDTSCSFSLDDSKILFVSYRTGTAQIFVMDSSGSNEIQLTDTESWNIWPGFSPDNSQIVFLSGRDGQTEIYIMNSDGSGQKRLTNSENSESRPQFSPDGDKIIYLYSGDIYSMNIDGSNIKNLTEGLGGTNPQFQPMQ